MEGNGGPYSRAPLNVGRTARAMPFAWCTSAVPAVCREAGSQRRDSAEDVRCSMIRQCSDETLTKDEQVDVSSRPSAAGGRSLENYSLNDDSEAPVGSIDRHPGSSAYFDEERRTLAPSDQGGGLYPLLTPKDCRWAGPIVQTQLTLKRSVVGLRGFKTPSHTPSYSPGSECVDDGKTQLRECMIRIV